MNLKNAIVLKVSRYVSNPTSRSLNPFTLIEAQQSSEWALWEKAMNDEMNSLYDNQTWSLVDLPKGRKPINCIWFFKNKVDEAENVNRHKARLVIKGCSQRNGVDNEKTFSPVVRYTTIRYLMSMAVKFNLSIDQIDAVTSFLQSELSEDIYIVQPEKFSGGTNKECKLKKAFYGLKQASRTWNNKLNSVLLKLGFIHSNIDPCVIKFDNFEFQI